MKHFFFTIFIASSLMFPVRLLSMPPTDPPVIVNVDSSVIITVKHGAVDQMHMNVGGSLHVNNFGAIVNDGSIKVSGDFENNGVFSSAINSIVSLNGGTQQIGGSIPTTFSNLEIDGTANKQCAINTTISQSLIFTNNKILIGNYDLRLLPGATISGANNSKFVVTNGSGFLKVKALPTSTDFLFPIGTSATSYKPVTLNYTGTIDTFRVRAIAGVTPTTGADNRAVQATYQVEELVAGGSNASLKLGWNTIDEGSSFIRTNAVMWQNASSVWNILSGTPGAISNSPATDWYYQASGITNLSSTASSFILNLQSRPLNLSALRLEGLYLGGGTMQQAQDQFGAHWPTGVADKINVELHSSSNYATIVTTLSDISLSTTGTASVNVPAAYNGNYYITIRHRNSLATTTASPVSFTGSIISQSFGTPSNVYGNNLISSGDGSYLIYGGDVNQDGFVDTDDYTGIDNDSFNFLHGYLVTDVNGDGIIDTGDYTIVDNNNYNFVGVSHP